MIFGKTGQKLDELSAVIRNMEEGLKLQSHKIETADKIYRENAGQTEKEFSELKESVEESRRQIRRQSDSFEDLIEELQEQHTLQDLLEKKTREYETGRKSFLDLITLQREQMVLLKQTILSNKNLSEDGRKAWEAQFRMMEEDTLHGMTLCGIQETGAVGEKADYRFCDVQKVVDTQDENLDGVIAALYRPGYFYQGKMLKKASVAAYRYVRKG